MKKGIRTLLEAVELIAQELESEKFTDDDVLSLQEMLLGHIVDWIAKEFNRDKNAIYKEIINIMAVEE